MRLLPEKRNVQPDTCKLLKTLLGAAGCLFVAQACYAIEPIGDWSQQIIESDVSGEGRNSSLAIAADGLVHVLYYDETPSGLSQLKHAEFNGIAWGVSVIDDAKGDQTVVRIDSAGRLHVAYNNVIGESRAKYGLYDGSSWSLEGIHTSELRGREVSLVLDDSDNPAVSFSDNRGLAAHYATRVNGEWVNERVVGNTVPSAIELNDAGNPVIFASSGRLLVATRAVDEWALQSFPEIDLSVFPTLSVASSPLKNLASR